MRFHEIIPGRLYQRGLLDARAIPDLKARGVRTVVALTGPSEEPVRSWLQRTGGRYLHIPIADGKKIPRLEQLATQLAARLHDEPTVIHCRAGRNRSGLLSALIVREHLGVSGAEALLYVQERRPNALANEHFCSYLRELPAPGKLSTTTTEVAGMSEQQDLIAQARELGLVDDETDQPELTTTDDQPVEQIEIQPKEADGRTWVGAEQLRPYLVRIEDLKETPGNPFKGKAHVAKLMASLNRFGQVRAILADAEDAVTIRAGHHLKLAAEELGWTHLAVINAEFNDQGEALAYLLADNRLARVGDEEAKAIEQLTIIDLIGEGNLEGTGWDLDSVETLRAEAGTTPVIVEPEPWGGEAAETAEEAAARAAALSNYEPHKEIPLYMTLPEHEQFSEHVRLLQNAWGLGGVMATILRALSECYEREAAPVPGDSDVSLSEGSLAAGGPDDDDFPL